MTDEITIKLPISGKEVVIRNYTTRKDDAKANESLYAGVSMDDKKALFFPLENMLAATDVYIRRLVTSIDGEAVTSEQLEDLRSQDYEAIRVAVDEIIAINSPKVKQVQSN